MGHEADRDSGLEVETVPTVVEDAPRVLDQALTVDGAGTTSNMGLQRHAVLIIRREMGKPARAGDERCR